MGISKTSSSSGRTGSIWRIVTQHILREKKDSICALQSIKRSNSTSFVTKDVGFDLLIDWRAQILSFFSLRMCCVTILQIDPVLPELELVFEIPIQNSLVAHCVQTI